MMKKILVLLCVFLTLTACGANGGSGDAARTGSPSTSDSGGTAPEPERREPERDAAAGRALERIEAARSEDAADEAEPTATKPDTADNRALPESRPDTADSPEEPEPVRTAESENDQEAITAAKKMNVQVGAYTFTAALEDNDAVRELTEMMRAGPVTIDMSDYAGFEKVRPLGRDLPTSSSQITAAAGDIVLYNGNSIVMFYGSNSWSYTRIGKIDDLTDWTAALGGGDVTAIFTAAE